MPISHRSNPRPMGSSFAGVQENQRDSLVSEKTTRPHSETFRGLPDNATAEHPASGEVSS